ncbi:hypothetical protein NC652_041587 [Populus alba x Populus x berolinensis]|nr:hypothetical protein NC652_041587 [Populus alba x Populus x berolinensis]
MTNKRSFYFLDVELEDPKQKPSLSNPSIISFHQTQSLYFSSQISLITGGKTTGWNSDPYNAIQVDTGTVG